jgi:hypothetical protein
VTCDECLRSIGTADLRALADGQRSAAVAEGAELAEHLASCARCSAAGQLLIAAEQALSLDLATMKPRASADDVARSAWTSLRLRRRRMLVVTIAITVTIAAAGGAAYVVVPEARRLLAPPPPVITRTFPLTCLSPEQAASLLRPYLPLPENPRWQAERFDVSAAVGIGAVTVRAPRELIDRVPALLAEFERYPTAACRR